MGRILINAINELFGGPISDLLIYGILTNVEWAFMTWQDELEASADRLAQTPANFFGGDVLALLQVFSNTIILPIAVSIFGLIVAYEFVSMLAEGNNFRDFDYTHLFKWMAKVVIGAFLLSNVFPIINWIFSLGAAAVVAVQGILNVEALDTATIFENLEEALRNDYDVSVLINIWLTSFLLGFFMIVCRIMITVIVIYRMFLIVLKISLAPIPFATLINREWSNVGNNYIKLLMATSFQGFLMMVVLGLYGIMMTLVYAPNTAAEALVTMFVILALSVMLIMLLLKSQQIAKSIFGAS